MFRCLIDSLKISFIFPTRVPWQLIPAFFRCLIDSLKIFEASKLKNSSVHYTCHKICTTVLLKPKPLCQLKIRGWSFSKNCNQIPCFEGYLYTVQLILFGALADPGQFHWPRGIGHGLPSSTTRCYRQGFSRKDK